MTLTEGIELFQLKSFSKYHGAQNDFFLAQARFAHLQRTSTLDQLRAWTRQICERRTGLGADGVVLLERVSPEQVQTLILNADGSLAATCGNALRCLSHYAHDQWQLASEVRAIRPEMGGQWQSELSADENFATLEKETFAICQAFQRSTELSTAGQSTVCMGEQTSIRAVDRELLSLFFEGFGLKEPQKAEARFVQLKNPHLVILSNEFSEMPLSTLSALGRGLQDWSPKDLGIPASNIGLLSGQKGNYRLTVYERGAGLTYCCGSGATAAFGLLEDLESSGSREPEFFQMPGGLVQVGGPKDNRWLKGPSEKVFDF